MDIAKGTKLVCNIWMISGLPIYKLRNGKFKCTISKSFIFPLAFLIINIACVVKFQKFTNELHCSITILQFSTLYLLNFGILYYSYSKRKTIETIFFNFLVINKMVGQFYDHSFPSTNIGKQLLKYVMLQMLLTLVVLLEAFTFGHHHDLQFYIDNLCYSTGTIFSLNLNLILFFYLFTLQILHKNFHEAVKNNMKENIAIDFQQIAQIYDLLQKIFIDINNTFQKPILLKIFNDFIHAVTISFYTVSTLSELTPMTTYVIILIAAAIWLTETLISIFVIAYYFEGISEQVPFYKKIQFNNSNCLQILGQSYDGTL
jgi:hypothetical protein